MAYFSYRQYYPPLESEYSHRPYSPRIKREDEEILPTHNHATSGSGFPFVRPSAPPQSHGSNPYGPTNDEEYELEGTVLRPHPEPLEDMWKKDVHGAPVQERSTSFEGEDQPSLGSGAPTLPPIGTSLPPQVHVSQHTMDNPRL